MGSDVQVYSSLFDVNLQKLPIGVLKAIKAAVVAELQCRNREVSAQRELARDVQSTSNRVFLGLPKPHHAFTHHWFGYLKALLEQDWSHLFPGGDCDGRYYVYLHITPRTKHLNFSHPKCRIHTCGLPFYVGKGTGDRAYDLKRNDGHGAILRDLKKSGHDAKDIVCVVQSGLSESQALELESKLIYFFGTRYEKGRKGLLVNLDIPPRPIFEQ